MKRILRVALPILMCIAMSAGLYGVIETGSDDNEIIYSTAATTIRRVSDTTAETDDGAEPYQSLQWALYNDGTFNSIDQSVPEFTDNGTYEGGGFTMPDEESRIPDDSNTGDAYQDYIDYYNDWIDQWLNEWINSDYVSGWFGGNDWFGGNSWFGGNGQFGGGSQPGGGSGRGGNNGYNRGRMNNTSFFGSGFEIRINGLSDRSWTWSWYNDRTEAVEDVDIDAVEAWELLDGDEKEVIVAVIDTGIDYTHVDLTDSIWINTGETSSDKLDNDANGYIDDIYGWNFYSDSAKVYSSNRTDEYTHGTHVAGIIAAQINGIGVAGIAPDNVKIMVIKALGGSDGEGTTDDIVEAIKYAESMGATICNLSFGTTDNDEELYQAMKDSNMLFICAAGNGDSDGTGVDTDVKPLYPASYDLDNIISVANLTYDGTLDESSNYGLNTVDIAAPGTEILSTSAGGEYEYLSGTSMAAPMVTAVAATVYSYYDDISLDKVREIILNSAEPLDSLTGYVSTGGMVNLYNALTYIEE